MLPTKEGIRTEFKQSFTDDVIVSLVAFVNAKGGDVYVGMCDDGTVCGVTLGKETIQKWINDIKQKTEPSIIPDVEIEEEDGKQVVVLSVPEYPVKPVSMKGRYYVRQANSNHLMSAFEISNAILRTKNSSWDYYVDTEHTVADIDLAKVQSCIDKMKRRGVSIEESPVDFLRKKDFINGENITFGCYLLFKAREDIMTTIELGFFQDSEGVIIKDSARLKNCLVSQVDDVMDYVKKHINLAIEIVPTQTENIQRWDYPLDAIREIVLNMIVHRDYRSSADSVVKIFPDRMEFYNPGILSDDITIHDLMTNNYSSRPRNKQIADLFKEMGDIEKYGSGIRRVMKMFSDYGLPVPEWKVNSGGMLVTVRKDDSMNDSDERGEDANGELNGTLTYADSDTNSDTNSVTGSVTSSDTDSITNSVTLSEKQKVVLDFCRKPRNAREIMDRIGISYHSKNMKIYVKDLVKRGYLQLTIPDKPNSPAQKYVATDYRQRK